MNKLLLPFLSLLLLALPAGARPDHPAEYQLVTVRVTYQAWNEYRPWQKAKPRNRTCLGTVMPGNRILVPAAYLDDATLIQLESLTAPPASPPASSIATTRSGSPS